MSTDIMSRMRSPQRTPTNPGSKGISGISGASKSIFEDQHKIKEEAARNLKEMGTRIRQGKGDTNHVLAWVKMKVKDNKDPNAETPTERVTKKILQALLEGLGLEGIDLAAHFALTKKVMSGNPRNQTKTTVIFSAFLLTKLNG